jgi:DNA-binding MarR family transcriptional regulator
MTESGAKQFRDLPPSAKLVFKTLEYADGELTQQDIVVRSRLSARTARYALDRLESNEMIDKRIDLTDARQDLYKLS